MKLMHFYDKRTHVMCGTPSCPLVVTSAGNSSGRGLRVGVCMCVCVCLGGIREEENQELQIIVAFRPFCTLDVESPACKCRNVM